MTRKRIFTVLIMTHNRPTFLREAVSALFKQTYEHIEIILINSGGTPETIDTSRELAALDKRVKVIHFEENQYRLEDPLNVVYVCLNAGLKAGTGDYVWYQNDDDLLAPDYIEKMVALFEENPDCTTAAGLPVSINFQGHKVDNGPRRSNFRPCYMPGHELTLKVLQGDKKLFSAPGTIFAIKRNVLVKAGGYHRSIENSHLYGIVPFGVTGFDETALFYWRYHKGQLNQVLKRQMGWLGLREAHALLKEWDIERRWQVFGHGMAREVITAAKSEIGISAPYWFVNNLLESRFKASVNILTIMWIRPSFWLALPGGFATYLRQDLIPFVRSQLKILIGRLFEYWPSLANRSVRLARLRDLVSPKDKLNVKSRPDTRTHLFTIIMLTHNRPAFLKEAVQALFAQTYQHLEIILLNNAGTPETVGTLRELAASDKRVKVIHFKENQYCPDDPLRIIHVCFNAGLKAAAGDYVWYQNDDDLLAPDYVEKMVRLFKGNPDCTTAAGLPVSINAEGNKIDGELRTSNFRPRYIPGQELALKVLQGDKEIFGTPGVIFTIKRDVLIKAGGYHRSIENSHLYGIVPFGMTGFDETALFYWRRHKGQFNKHMLREGWIGISEAFSLFKDWEIEHRWQVFGRNTARKMVARAENRICVYALNWFTYSLLNSQIKASFRIFLKIWKKPRFWWGMPGVIWICVKEVRGDYLMKPIVKPIIRRLFGRWPNLANKSRGLAKLRERVAR